VRLFFVAYSRAKRLLVLTGNLEPGKWDRVLPGAAHVRNANDLGALGVHLL
jgi:hypothetical protein